MVRPKNMRIVWKLYREDYCHLSPVNVMETNHQNRPLSVLSLCPSFIPALYFIASFCRKQGFLWLRFHSPNWRLHVVGDLPAADLGALPATILLSQPAQPDLCQAIGQTQLSNQSTVFWFNEATSPRMQSDVMDLHRCNLWHTSKTQCNAMRLK